MAAIKSAVEMGSHGVEFDIHHTYDGETILMHDKTLERTSESKPGRKCPLTKKIAALQYSDIKNNCQLKNGEEIPLLDDVLEYMVKFDIYVFVEFKDFPGPETMFTLKKYYED